MLALETHGDVTRLRFSTPVSRALGYEVSAYAVRGMLVDTGFPAVARELAGWLDEARLKGVVVTHHHEDHAGNLELISRGALPVAIAPVTLRAVRELGPLDLYRRICWGQPPALATEVTPFVARGLRLIHLPGHSPDHHVVWDEEHGTLFAGDLFIGVKVRIAQDDEVVSEQIRSLRAAIALKPERVFCAHRGPLTNPVETLKAKADWLEEISGEVNRLAFEGHSESAITTMVLGREGTVAYTSRGKLSKRNLVRAVLKPGGGRREPGGGEA
jgi:glyoxylase-like metal-dependent hydrolase (beta-lactamase superfamily II)